MKTVLLLNAVPEERVEITIGGCRLVPHLTGIGKVRAAADTMRLLHVVRPDYVLNVGTAGTLKHRVGDIIVAQNYVDRDYEKLEIPGVEWQLGDTFGASALLPPSIVGGVPKQETFTVNTGDDFVTAGNPVRGDVIDMEGFAIAWACREWCVPLLSVKYVTDVVGQNSVAQWAEKLAAAREGLGKYFEAYTACFSRLFLPQGSI